MKIIPFVAGPKVAIKSVVKLSTTKDTRRRFLRMLQDDTSPTDEDNYQVAGESNVEIVDESDVNNDDDDDDDSGSILSFGIVALLDFLLLLL